MTTGVERSSARSTHCQEDAAVLMANSAALAN